MINEFIFKLFGSCHYIVKQFAYGLIWILFGLQDAQAQLGGMRPQLGCSFGEPQLEDARDGLKPGVAPKILGIQLLSVCFSG